MLLPDGIALVLVATGALDGHRQKVLKTLDTMSSRSRLRATLPSIFDSGTSGRSNVIPRVLHPVARKPSPRTSHRVGREKSVARNLFLTKRP